MNLRENLMRLWKPAGHGRDVFCFNLKLLGATLLALGVVPLAAGTNPDGSFSNKIEIKVPAGTKNMAPNLSLDYNSNGGNGIVGMGWQLGGFSVITRVAYGSAINYDANDTFTSMAGILVKQADGTYRSKNESFTRFTSSGTTCGGPCSWTVQDASGATFYFGDTDDSRIEKVGSTAVRVWALSRAVDSNGNSYVVSYNEDPASGAFYPARITYTVGAGISTYQTVEFTYEGRGDVTIDTAGGATVNLAQRLQWVTVRSAGALVRKYRLEYECGLDSPPNSGTCASTNRSRLISVLEYGSDGTSTLPAQTFGWQEGGTGFQTDAKLANLDKYPVLQDGSYDYTFADMDGDGRTDILYNPANEGGFRVRLTATGAESNWGARQHPLEDNKERQYIDANGDGKTDVVYRRKWTNELRALISTGTSFQADQLWGTLAYGVENTNGRYHYALGDVTGDGIVDFVYLRNDSKQLRVLVGSPTGFAPDALWGIKDFSVASVGTAWAYDLLDMNGDGLADLVYQAKDTKKFYVLLSTGTTFQPQILWGAYTGKIADQGKGRRWADVNGDGKIDLIYQDTNEADPCGFGFLFQGGAQCVNTAKDIRVLLNTGAGFAADVVWGQRVHDIEYDGANYAVNVLDMNGDGPADVLYLKKNSAQLRVLRNTGAGFGADLLWGTKGYAVANSGALWAFYQGNEYDPSAAEYAYGFADVSGDGRPDMYYVRNSLAKELRVVESDGPVGDLLVSISNGLGGTTTITYSPATQVPGAVVPSLTSPGNANPAPQMLVTSVTTTDGRGGSYSSSYSYYNNRYYPGPAQERAGLGFAWFRETNDNAGTSEITYFSQTKPYHGRPYQKEGYAGTALMARSTYAYDVVYPNPGTSLVRPVSETKYTYNMGALAFARTKTTTYDGYGNPTIVTESGGGLPTVSTTTTYASDTGAWALGRPTAIVVTSGTSTLKQTTIAYTGANATQTCDWLAGSTWACTSMSHDINGNLISTTDALGRVTTTEYDGAFRANVTRITNALGHVAEKTVDAGGAVTSETDVNGNVSSTTFDSLGRPLQVNLPNGGRTTYAYVAYGDPNNQYKQTTVRTDGARTLVKRTYFDGMGFVYRETSTGDTGEVLVLKNKDAAGRSHQTSLPFYSTETPQYMTDTFDAAGRVVAQSLPGGGLATHAYGTGTVTSTDTNGKTRTKTFDAAGRVTALTDAMGNTTAYGYDAAGRVTSTTLADGSTIAIAYDGMGRKTSITEPNTGTTTFAYDLNGNLLSQTGARGLTINYAYDELNRVTARTFPVGAGTNVAYRYDEPTFSNGKGRLTSKTDAGGITQIAYDATGQVTTEQMIVDGKSYSYTMVFDLAKRPAQVTYPDGSVVAYTYTNGANLSTVALNGTTYATWTNYDAAGRPANVAHGNNTATVYTYGALGKLNTLETTGPAGQLQNLAYAINNAGHVSSITDNRADKTVGGMNTDETVIYAYDDLERMTVATGVWGVLNYAYNSVGNMTGAAGRSLSYTGQRATSGTNFAAVYDAAGNMTARTIDGAAWTYSYDAENRLVTAKEAGTLRATMVYDDKGQRVKKIYNRPDGSTVTAVYIGSGYEVRKRDGKEFHSMNLQGNGQLIASVTREGTMETSMLNRFNTEIALAGAYSASSIIGLVSKCGQYLAAALAHPRTARFLAYGFSLGLFVGILGLSLWSFARAAGRLGLRAVQGRSVFGARIRTIGLLTALVFSQTYCMQGGSGGPGSWSWLTGGSGMYYVDPSHALSGDTLNGLPLGTYFYHKNQINSSSVITDATGTETTRIIYKPYGAIDQAHSPGTDAVTKKFTGQEFDEETGLYYYNARYYDPAIGRFVTADTIVPENGKDPQGFNRYSYVKNNPVNYTDPSGHSWLKDVWKAYLNNKTAFLNELKMSIRANAAFWKFDGSAGTAYRKWVRAVEGHTMSALGVFDAVIDGNQFIGAIVMAVVAAFTAGAAGALWAAFQSLLKSAVMAIIMQMPIVQNLVSWVAKGLTKLGASAQAAGMFAGTIVSLGISYGGGLLAKAMPSGEGRVHPNYDPDTGIEIGDTAKVTGMFTNSAHQSGGLVGHAVGLFQDVGDILKGVYGLPTNTSMQILRMNANGTSMFYGHSLGNLDLATASASAPNLQWAAYDSPFFTNTSSAVYTLDGANILGSGGAATFVQGFGLRGLLPGSHWTTVSWGHADIGIAGF